VFVEIGVFRKKTDIPATSDFAAIDTEDLGAAGGGRDESKNHLHGGGLPGTVGADEAVNLAVADLEA